MNLPATQPDQPVPPADREPDVTFGEILGQVLFWVDAAIVGATVFPGALLCVPVFVLVAAVVLAPVIALALIAIAVGLATVIVTAPVWLTTFVLRRRRARRPQRVADALLVRS